VAATSPSARRHPVWNFLPSEQSDSFASGRPTPSPVGKLVGGSSGGGVLGPFPTKSEGNGDAQIKFDALLRP